jgi:hypothetical protein
MSSPQLVAQSNRTSSETDIRELVRAKMRAQAAWDAFCHQNRSYLSEEQLIDREIESIRLCRALNAADDALRNAL